MKQNITIEEIKSCNHSFTAYPEDNGLYRDINVSGIRPLPFCKFCGLKEIEVAFEIRELEAGIYGSKSLRIKKIKNLIKEYNVEDEFNKECDCDCDY